MMPTRYCTDSPIRMNIRPRITKLMVRSQHDRQVIYVQAHGLKTRVLKKAGLVSSSCYRSRALSARQAVHNPLHSGAVVALVPIRISSSATILSVLNHASCEWPVLQRKSYV